MLVPVAREAGAERPRRHLTFYHQILLALFGVNALVMVFIGIRYYTEQKTALFKDMDKRLAAVATLARETLPSDYHDRITGPESVTDEEFQKIVDRNNQLCQKLGLEYIWSLLLADGKIVFTSSTSPDKIAANRKHAKFYEPHSNPELYTNTFATMRATYKGNVDKWGDIRVALVPFRDAHGRKYLFGASVRTTEVARQLREVVRQSAAVGLIGFVFSMAVGLWAARRITRPIICLTDTIRAISAGRTDLEADETGSVEMALLARHFNLMNRFLQGRIADLEVSHGQLAVRHDRELQHVSGSLKKSEQRYRGLLNFAVDGILLGSPDGKIVEANEGMSELFGLARSEIVGKHISLMPFTAESLAANPLRFDLLHKGEKVVTERTILRKDGSEVIVEMHSKRMPDGTLQSIYRDITRRKRAEQALLKSEQRYKNLLNFAASGVLVCDDRGDIIDANECLSEICGLSQAELVGRNICDLPFAPESLRQFPLRVDLVQSGEMVTSERVIRRRDGSEVVVDMRTKKMPDGSHQSIWNDVTGRKQEENALQETRRMLEEAQRLAKLGAWKYDVATRQLTWTEEVYRIHGVSREYLVSRLADDVSFAAPEYEGKMREAFRGAVERGVPYDVELEIIRPDGRRVWVRASGRPILADGKIVRVDGHLMDITENKQVEDRLLHSQRELSRQNEVLNALLRNLTVGVVMVDAKSTAPLVTNNAALQLMGVSAVSSGDMLSHLRNFTFLSGADRKVIPTERLPISRALHGESTQSEEIVVVRADGSEQTLEFFATPVKNEDGSIWAALTSFVGISERKRAEAALLEARRMLEESLRIAKLGAWKCDVPTGKCVWTDEIYRIFGVDRDFDANDREAMLQFVAVEYRPLLVGAFRQAVELGEAYDLELEFVRSSGECIWVRASARPLVVDGRVVRIDGTFMDITDRKRTQALLESWTTALERRVAERTEEVERYARQLQALTERVARVEQDERHRIANVLHEDVQQTLAAARMTLGAVKDKIRSADARETLERADDMLAQSIKLTRTLVRDIAVPGVRERDLVFAVGWLSQLMREKFGLEVSLVKEGPIPQVDENTYFCLYRAIQEMLFNVVKHAHVRKALVALGPDGGGRIKIVIADKGRGISADEKRGGGDGGFGLFSTRERIEGLGGEMSVEGEAGKGTTVVFLIPVRM